MEAETALRIARLYSRPERAGTELLGNLRSWAPNLRSSCRNFGVWLPELCSEILSPEATNLAESHYLAYLYCDYRCVLKYICLFLP